MYLQRLPGMHGYVSVISMRREKCPTDKHFSAKARNCLTNGYSYSAKKNEKKRIHLLFLSLFHGCLVQTLSLSLSLSL